MLVRDNGKGFAVDRKPEACGKRRLGLLGMQERVRSVGGRLAIKSAPGRGTSVTVQIPLKRRGRSAVSSTRPKSSRVHQSYELT